MSQSANHQCISRTFPFAETAVTQHARMQLYNDYVECRRQR